VQINNRIFIALDDLASGLDGECNQSVGGSAGTAKGTLTHHFNESFGSRPDVGAKVWSAIYTTNSVESLHRSLRKIIKTRGGFPNEEAALKLLFLALRQAANKWTMPIHHWRQALNRLTILWPDRLPALERTHSPKTKPRRLHRTVDTPQVSSFSSASQSVFSAINLRTRVDAYLGRTYLRIHARFDDTFFRVLTSQSAPFFLIRGTSLLTRNARSSRAVTFVSLAVATVIS